MLLINTSIISSYKNELQGNILYNIAINKIKIKISDEVQT